MNESKRGASHRQSTKMAFCGLMAALSIVIMLISGMVPVLTYCAPMFAGFILIPVMIEYGNKTALVTYAAAAAVILILDVDKEAAFFYLFFGNYPILKGFFDRIHRRSLRLIAKVAYFTCATVVMYGLLSFVLGLDAVVSEFKAMGPVLLVGFVIFFNICMLLYDFLIVPYTRIYIRRLKPRLRFLQR